MHATSLNQASAITRQRHFICWSSDQPRFFRPLSFACANPRNSSTASAEQAWPFPCTTSPNSSAP